MNKISDNQLLLMITYLYLLAAKERIVMLLPDRVAFKSHDG